MSSDLTRREVLIGGLVVSALPVSSLASGTEQFATTRIPFRLEETAGLRRFGFPVSTVFSAPGKSLQRFQLLRNQKPVPAQFRPVERAGVTDPVALDFNTSVGPLEHEDYEVVFGTQIEPGPEPKGGLKLSREGKLVRVGERTGLHWEFPEDLSSWVNRSASGKLVYLDGTPSTLSIGLKDGGSRSYAQPRDRSAGSLTVDRQGPLAISLRHEANIMAGPPGGLRSTVELNFVSSKSWIEVRWSVDDPLGLIRDLEAAFTLKLDGTPNLVDFGASSWVYEQMRAKELTTLEANPLAANAPRWSISKTNEKGVSSLFAVAAADDRRPVEGWAHVFDDTRCTALAVEGFGKATRDQITLAGSGLVSVKRTFPGDTPQAQPPRGVKRELVFWVHVVPTPVQIGALTSPQAILGPPAVRWQPR